jgi:GTPase
MQFVDQVSITVKAGDGGNGLVAFRREKGIPRGGPAGGDGGVGGSVIFRANSNLNTLVDLRYKHEYLAQRGGDGGPSQRHGKNGTDLVIDVPVGTVVYDAESGLVLADIVEENEERVIAKGGAGGRGNESFATSRLHTPRFAERGEPTEPLKLTLELKLVADVGLVGFPNVGKSTLIARISAARPKIADYPFTTLVPNLGVVKVDEHSFVVADMPGLIEGASQGAGLGLQFLRHIERTRLLVHLIDVSGFSGREPEADFDAINAELAAHSERLAVLPQLVALNKSDVSGAAEIADGVEAKLKTQDLEVFRISAVTGEGVQKLLYRVADKLSELPREPVRMAEEAVRFSVQPEEGFEVHRDDDGAFVVTGKGIEMLIARTDTGNEYALRRLHKQLDRVGVIKELRKVGVTNGDTVRIKDMEFDFTDEAW